MKYWVKLLGIFFLLTAIVLLSACAPNTPTGTWTSPGTTSGSVAQKNTVTILYTNDIHAYLNNDTGDTPGISYAQLAQLKKDLGENVLLVDAGDHMQGSVYGAMDQGQTVLELMNGLYDLAVIGNHEFDYGIDRLLYATSHSEYPYICCNFVHKQNGEPVLKPYKVVTVGNVKVGFVGIITPETLTSTAPSYFQDESGAYIYDFLDGEALYAAVQCAVDAMVAQGADYIIALGHVGVDQLSEMTSRSIIENVSGLDVFIDGHSHTELEKELVQDKAGAQVLLTQTGYYFGSVGKLTLGQEGIDTELIKTYDAFDEAVENTKNDWVQDVEEMLGEKIGVLGSTLSVNDENGDRLVRVRGTNLGEFVADSYYFYINFVSGLDCDVAIINGGGLRASIESGDVTYMSLKATNPFGNQLCAVELTGQQLLDMLEWGSRLTTGVAGEFEEGSFLHTAGLTYRVDTSIPSTVQQDNDGFWTGAPTGAYRVKDVMIFDKTLGVYVPLELDKLYCVGGTNYTLINWGGGFEMLGGSVVKDYIVEDYMALAAYAISFADVDGDGFSDIVSTNSPLYVYKGYDMHYEELAGMNRANVE